jgi:hypothetical protein
MYPYENKLHCGELTLAGNHGLSSTLIVSIDTKSTSIDLSVPRRVETEPDARRY